MTFDELVADVYIITSRPDLSDETESAVKRATLKAHQSDYYSRDIVEVAVPFNNPCYIQSIDLFSLICNFRAMKYLRVSGEALPTGAVGDTCDPNQCGSSFMESARFIDFITPEELLDSYGRNRCNVAYQAGRMLEVRANADISSAILGCYVNPIVTPAADYGSWVAQVCPDAIINEAARVIFKMIGYDEQSAQYNALVGESYSILKIIGLGDVGS